MCVCVWAPPHSIKYQWRPRRIWRKIWLSASCRRVVDNNLCWQEMWHFRKTLLWWWAKCGFDCVLYILIDWRALHLVCLFTLDYIANLMGIIIRFVMSLVISIYNDYKFLLIPSDFLFLFISHFYVFKPLQKNHLIKCSSFLICREKPQIILVVTKTVYEPRLCDLMPKLRPSWHIYDAVIESFSIFYRP